MGNLRRTPLVLALLLLPLTAYGPAADAVVVGVPGIPVLSPSAQAASAGGGTPLTGTFRATAGSCSGGVHGSWFQMLSPTGSPVSNNDSSCSDKTYTPLSPGTDGGLVTGSYQADPSPAFDGAGNGLANRIFQPTKFYGVQFAVATDPTDPQTGTAVRAPSVSTSGGTLSGDLRAFTVSWNNQHFNQGSPKPDGSTPGKTSGPTGTYNSSTGAFKITWSSQIVGGPFNNFIGTWQIEGTFVPAASSGGTGTDSGTPTTSDPGASSGSGATSPGAGASPASSNDTAAPPTSTSADATGTSLPVTGGNLPVLPAAGLLAAGLIVRRARRWLPRRPA